MLLSGFTFIRNARKYDFPLVECVESMLPIVDELVVNLGNSDDDTDKIVESIRSPKIKLIRSVWDDTKTDRGLVLSEQTNIALDACQGRWALYLQADEALHESEYEYLLHEVGNVDNAVDGLRFKYLHFYGGYTLVQRAWNWYPSEIRLIRRESGARSYGDAQTFRKADGSELKTRLIDAHVFHYGHAREPEAMARKIRYFHRFWHGDEHGIAVDKAYQLSSPSRIKNLVWYWGSHPATYEKRVSLGQAWSPAPGELIKKKFNRVVLFHSKAKEELALANSVKALLEAQNGIAVETVGSLTGWLKLMLRSIFSVRRRRSSALVDLYAEKRSLFEFLFWIMDACSAFSWRIAHVPAGKLCKFRVFFYNAVNWGAHENTEQGFQVPPEEHPKQILRWLGIEP